MKKKHNPQLLKRVNLVGMQGYDNHIGAANTAQMRRAGLIQSGNLERAESYLNMNCNFYRRTGMYPYLVRTLSSLAQLFEKQWRIVEATYPAN